MSLIYKVDPGKLGDKTTKISTKRNMFSGSSGRIVVDEIEDDEDISNWDEMDAEADEQNSITNLLRMRIRHGENRN